MTSLRLGLSCDCATPLQQKYGVFSVPDEDGDASTVAATPGQSPSEVSPIMVSAVNCSEEDGRE